MMSDPDGKPDDGTGRPDLDLDQKIDVALEKIRQSRFSYGITSWQRFPAANADLRKFPDSLHPELADILVKKGFGRLYSHQAAAWDAVQRGENPVIVTPTASGKTLCYNLPVLDRLLRDPGKRALYLYPAKALAQDQYHDLISMAADLKKKIKIGIYDGDTPASHRTTIRQNAQLIMTNPDMLHTGILPHHSRWSQFFSKLDYIVIDEMHQYRGIFGSHLCNVLRRLRRICRFYGAELHYILSSATIANPEELAGRLIGDSVYLINESGAPSGEKTFILYNPPVIDNVEMVRRSYLDEASLLVRILIDAGIQTIVFTRTRRNVELLLHDLRRHYAGKLENSSIQGYRGGYLPRERRVIEKGLRDGVVRCVVATSALELGVDIGDMGAAVMAGYPGTIASAWQRAGRAGRRENRSIAIMVASAAPLDQYIVRNPHYFFQHPVEHGLINPDNVLILLEHIRCAAFELPFTDGEYFADQTPDFLAYLEEDGELQHSSNRWFYTGGEYPAAKVSLRSVSGDAITIADHSTDKPDIIGELDVYAAHLLVHPEAVYLHGGRQYLVKTLDLENHRAAVVPMDLGYYTAPFELTRVDIIDTKLCSENSCPICFGDVQVVSRVVGYRKIRFGTQEVLGAHDLALPERELITTGAWFTLPTAIADYDRTGDMLTIAAGFVGALTAIHSVASVLLMSDPRDIGAFVGSPGNEWAVQTDHLGTLQLSGHPTGNFSLANLFIYDCYPGGIGLSESLYRKIALILSRAVELVEQCECRNGCPGCIGPVNTTEHFIKASAITVLRHLAQAFPLADNL
ncbi:MAG: DEAD/DEAH box helicase [bacterium]